MNKGKLFLCWLFGHKWDRQRSKRVEEESGNVWQITYKTCTRCKLSKVHDQYLMVRDVSKVIDFPHKNFKHVMTDFIFREKDARRITGG